MAEGKNYDVAQMQFNITDNTRFNLSVENYIVGSSIEVYHSYTGSEAPTENDAIAINLLV